MGCDHDLLIKRSFSLFPA
jgi:NAD(P)H dehydrogenase (quinone)